MIENILSNILILEISKIWENRITTAAVPITWAVSSNFLEMPNWYLRVWDSNINGTHTAPTKIRRVKVTIKTPHKILVLRLNRFFSSRLLSIFHRPLRDLSRLYIFVSVMGQIQKIELSLQPGGI